MKTNATRSKAGSYGFSWLSQLRTWLRSDSKTRSGLACIEQSPVQDDTDRKDAPEQPRNLGYHDQKMEALGRLTAGMAHDFNNLLAVVLGNASALRASAETRGNSSDASRALAIEGAAQRGGRLAAQLLAFSRKQVLRPEVVSAYTVLSELHDLLSRAAGDNIQTRLLANPDLWTCRVDPGQLESAILNLVINARDAMPMGGTITIACHNEKVAAPHARKSGGPPGDYVKVEVTDTGTGIPPELQDRVFEPFFTTKPIGQGSGLGLAQVHGFAGQSGGWVELVSVVGQGTTVSLLLPRANGAPQAEATADHDRTVLLVEPDPKRRSSIANKLRSAGYRVLEAWDKPGAARWIAAQEPVHLLITDTLLPAGHSGIELAREARYSRPDLLLLLISEAGTDEAARRFGADGRCEFLARSCQPNDIVRVTEALLRHGTFSREREELHAELRAAKPVYGRLTQMAPCTWPVPPPGHLHLGRHSVRLGVLPLKALDASRQRGFSLGLAEELTAALARFRWISCISPASVAALTEDAIGSHGRWQDLDLDYLLEGSFRQSGDAIRIIIRLINMREPAEISWSKRFDSRLTDILTLQDEIALDAAAQVAPEVLIREGEKAASRPQVDPTAYGLMLQAIPAIYRMDQAGFRSAGPLLKQALELDPSSAAAHSWLAHWYLLLVGQGWAKDPQQATQRADDLARRATLLDPTDARGLTVAGHIKAFLYKQAEQGLQLHAEALRLNPSLALAWCYAGLAHSYLGQHAAAIDHIGQAQRLSPHDPHGFFFDMAMVMPLLLTGDFARAAQHGRRAREANPGLSSTYKGLISALGFLGRLEEAQTLRQELSVLEPHFSIQEAISRSPLTRPEDLQCYADGLRLAGCEERTRTPPWQDGWRPLALRWQQARRLCGQEAD